jgi:hypothetical protein
MSGIGRLQVFSSTTAPSAVADEIRRVAVLGQVIAPIRILSIRLR